MLLAAVEYARPGTVEEAILDRLMAQAAARAVATTVAPPPAPISTGAVAANTELVRTLLHNGVRRLNGVHRQVHIRTEIICFGKVDEKREPRDLRDEENAVRASRLR